MHRGALQCLTPPRLLKASAKLGIIVSLRAADERFGHLSVVHLITDVSSELAHQISVHILVLMSDFFRISKLLCIRNMLLAPKFRIF
jgi:hypothetical protein